MSKTKEKANIKYWSQINIKTTKQNIFKHIIKRIILYTRICYYVQII